MSFKLIWPVGTSREALYAVRISRVLEREFSANVVFVTAFASTKLALDKIGQPSISLSDMLSETNTDLPHIGAAQIAEANRLLARSDINLLLHGDPLLSVIDRAKAQTFIAGTIFSLSKFIERRKFDMCLRYGGGDAFGQIISILAEGQQLNSYTLTSGATFDTCGLVKSKLNLQWYWQAFKERWEYWRERAIPDEEKSKIDERIINFHENHKKRPRTKMQSRLRGLAQCILQYLRSKRELRRMTTQDLLAEANMDSLIPLWEEYEALLKLKWLITYSGFKYDDVPEQYVYMPLNQPWDSPHRVANPMNYLQEYIATVASASLPYGCELVVKEHPYTYGDPNHATLKKFQEIGVRVVHPHVHSHELVKNAKAVFCVGDTTGWEAILFKTPVVVFAAPPFYVEYPHTLVVSDPNMVHSFLRDAVSAGDTAYKDKELWYSFLYSAFESSYPANIWAYKGLLWTDVDDSDENVQKMATMIAQEANISR